MKKFVAVMCVCCTLFSSIAEAFVRRDINVICEKTIPFSFNSDEMDFEEYIDLRKYSDFEVIDYYVDNGQIDVIKKGDQAEVSFFDGKYVEGIKSVSKVDTISVEEKLTDENKKTIIVECDEDILEIQEVNGDFKSAKVLDNNRIEILVDENAKGNIQENQEETVTSKINIDITNENRDKEVYSSYYETIYEPLSIKSVKSMNGNATVEVEDNKLRVLFSDGSPKLNESMRSDGYTYFWADRSVDGTFKKEYPNEVYRSNRFYFSGEGEYIEGEKALKELAYKVERDEKWRDYAGVIIDGQKYMYLYDNTKEVPKLNDRIILEDNRLSLTGQWCNAEKLDIEFSEDSIVYIPEGKLYSVGDLVKNTEGWGEVAENKSYESDEEFFNELTGKYETYVKHFKFFFGPKEKTTFGGYFTYPYSAIVEYEHYEPVTVYSGDVVYSYKIEEGCKGYNYNGWLKIKYSDEKSINDYPPTPPYNIRYKDEIIWSPGSDDYTAKEDLRYEIERKANDDWELVGITSNGITQKEYQGGKDISFRIRTIDEVGQVSDWGYSGESQIVLNGEVSPKVIKKGESITVKANTESLLDIVKVEVVCEELGINQELTKKSEVIPNYNEVSFDIWCTYEKNKFINTKNDTWAYNKGNKNVVDGYESKALTDTGLLSVNLPTIIEFTESGTVILPNQNYLDSPMEYFRFDDDWWHLETSTTLSMKNKITNKNESFLYFYNGSKYIDVNGRDRIVVNPCLKLHTFTYDEKGKIRQVKIPIDSSIAGDPISVTWDTVNGITQFNIFFGDTLVYIHNVKYEDIVSNMSGFTAYKIGKEIYALTKTTTGYIYKSNNKYYKWPEMKNVGSLNEIIWLGYKLKSSYYSEDKLAEYNNLDTTRSINRLLFMDESLNLTTIKKYLDLIKNTNLLIEDENSIFGKNVRERKCAFEGIDISTNKLASVGTYILNVIAYDSEDNIAFVELPIEVIDDEKQVINKTTKLGRFFYDKSKNGCIEELAKLKKDNLSEGFISAGETLALLVSSDAEYLEIDIEGNESIKTFDSLTKRFLVDEPNSRGEKVENLEDNYSFPLVIYPTNTTDSGENIFCWLYTIPYRTTQSLESWATIRAKSGDSENIDKNKLFDRIIEPYKIIIRENGDRTSETVIKVDVFERWDTVLNRNVSEFLTNYSEKWRIEL